jgi:RNA polymerase sigma-70 factor (ECF subfamily)
VGCDDSEVERAALQRLRRDPDAICVIYDLYVLRLVRFLQAEGATPEIAWDAAQEIEDLLTRLEAEGESHRLSTALDALAAEQREAIVERVIGGLDYAEVAALTGVSEGTVRTRVSRGLRRMRSLLLEGGS